MLYDDKFLSSLTKDPLAGARRACEKACQAVGSLVSTESDIEIMEEAEALLIEMSAAKLIPFTFSVPNDWPSRQGRGRKIYEELLSLIAKCKALEAQQRIGHLRTRFQLSLGARFAYEFSQADIERVQELLNELRSLVSSTNGFSPDHQRRLLARLEALQSELHKNVSDLDRFWGLVGDAGVVLAKLGNDAKPIVDRVREIADIVWNTQGRAEELPSSAKPPQIGYESAMPHSDE